MFFLSLIIILNLFVANIDLDDPVQLSTEELKLDGILMPTDIVIIDDFLVIKDDYQEFKIQIYDIKSQKKIGKFGSNGRGPGEYLSIILQKSLKSGHLEIVDVTNKKIDIVNLECIISNPALKSINTCISKTVNIPSNRHSLMIDTTTVVNHSIQHDGVVQLSNFDGKFTNVILKPLSILIDKYQIPIRASMSMTGELVSSYNREYFAYFADSFDFSVFYSYKNGHVSQIHRKQYEYLPEFNVVEYGGNSAIIEPAENYRSAYRSPDYTSDYYIVLYSGQSATDVNMDGNADWRSFTNEIHVYNLLGEKIKVYQLDTNVYLITVSLDGETLIGVTFDKELNPTIIRALL
ncbi:MAG TPA: hypothetical protein DCE78_06865 [Bacteroidetes bacterium]|nr:hypothetical protein [Bacteroidota bacterium]